MNAWQIGTGTAMAGGKTAEVVCGSETGYCRAVCGIRCGLSHNVERYR